MKGSNRKRILLGALLAVLAINVSQVSAAPSAEVKSERIKVAKKYDHLKERANKGEKLRVIVKLKDTDTPKLRHKSKAARKALLTNNKQKFSKLKGHLSRHKIKYIRDFSRLGFMVMEVDSEQLDQLIDSGLTVSVVEDEVVTASLDDSIPLIGADSVHASGYTGAGQAVAILDTGFETSHDSFGGRVVEEACFSSSSTTATSLCPSGEDTELGDGAATGCSPGTDGCKHGTHVASIAAGVNGVAPEANIVAVQVFHYTASSDALTAYTSDITGALEWVLNESTTENIASVNLSLGNSTEHITACDTDIRAAAVSALREAGIATVIASGNNYFTEGVSAPACISDAITVGNTTKQDTLRASSNSSELVDMLAPGTYITAAVPGNTYASLSGTSMAAPHVAGAFAVFRSVDSTLDVTTIETLFESTGVDVTDADNGVTKPRIDLNAAINAFIASQYESTTLWPNGSDPVASAAQDEYPATNVGDGNTDTRWSAEGAGQTITFDLGDTYSLSEIQIAFLKGDSRSTYFDLAISSDGTTFTTISSGLESSGSSTSLESFDIAGAAQYVQIIGQGNSSNAWNSLTEVEIIGAEIAPVLNELSADGISLYSYEQGEQTLTVTSNVDWTLTSEDSWITVSPASGSNNGESIISVAENTTRYLRQGTLVVTGGGLIEELNINQQGAPYVEAPTDLSVYVTAVGEITVSWTDESEEETGYLVEYARYHDGESSLYPFESITLGENSSSAVITGLLEDWYYVRVSAFDDETSSVATIKEWTFVEFDEGLEVTLLAPENFTVEVTASGEATLTWDDLSINETGYIVEYAQYSDDGDRLYSYQATTIAADSTSHVFSGLVEDDRYNFRVSSIYVTEQSEYSLVEYFRLRYTEDTLLALSTSSLDFSAEESSASVTVTANLDWTVSDDASWLSADVTSGSGDDIITFTVEKNTSTDSRSATITVSDGTTSQTISVKQAAAVSSEPAQLSITNATASSDDGNEVSNTLDNNFDTRWSANGEGEYVTYDLGAVKSLSSVQAAFYKGDSRNTYFSIAVSDNGTDFTTYLENETSSGASKALEEFLISTQARYVRIIGLGNSSNTWNSLTEVQIWGTEL